MKTSELKSLILNSVGKQKEFRIVEGPESGTLGVLVCDLGESARKTGFSLEFTLVVKNDLGQTGVSYFIQPQNILDKGYFCMLGDCIACRGFIREFETDKSSVKSEKHKLLKDGTPVYIVFNDETGNGVLKVQEENDGPFEFFKYAVGNLRKLVASRETNMEKILMN